MDMTGSALDEICAAMSTSETLADNLGGKTQVGRASCTLDVGSVAVEEFVIWRNDDRRG